MNDHALEILKDILSLKTKSFLIDELLKIYSDNPELIKKHEIWGQLIKLRKEELSNEKNNVNDINH